ncbi:hypothetical protein EOT10_01180 [Streptomyces antnestii]|uniref:Uncharacterized protein n=1 Tax=Streptomyces antnestii TaxID=2494256 RepID=A0A437Q211_9ACTN|nr:hypothetical protein EOT10_01180 [Streptomyces sp. San01]
MASRACRQIPVVRPEGGTRGVRLVRAIARRRSALVAEQLGRFGNAAWGSPRSSEAESGGVRARRRGAGGTFETRPSSGATRMLRQRRERACQASRGRREFDGRP